MCLSQLLDLAAGTLLVAPQAGQLLNVRQIETQVLGANNKVQGIQVLILVDAVAIGGTVTIQESGCSGYLVSPRDTVVETAFLDVAWSALAVRMAATALVVVLVSWSVGAFGPLIGGALAGLPMVLGPGFYFLSQQFPADYVQQAATYAVYSLSATQLFLLLIILCAPTLSPWRTLLCAVAGWAVAALLLSFMPVQPVLGLALFIAVTAFSLRVSRRLAGMKGTSKAKAGWGLLIFRGALAGLLVAIVTTSSSLLGPSLSGLIMAFPIGYTVVAVTIHQTLGAASLVATLRSALWGTGSLAGFCTTLALTFTHLHWLTALLLAAAVSIAITLLLVFRPWARRG